MVHHAALMRSLHWEQVVDHHSWIMLMLFIRRSKVTLLDTFVRSSVGRN